VVKVVIDLRMVRGPLHGIARYALELARRIPAIEPGWQFLGLTGPDGVPDDLGDLAPRIPLVRCNADFLAPLEQPALAGSLMRIRPDLFHATSFSLPALWGGPLVATIHDANHLALADTRSRTKQAYYQLIVRPRARRARALITVSEFSRSEISTHLRLPPERLQVISNGVDASFAVPPQSELDDFRSRRGLPQQFFAAVGSIKAHKNLSVLRDVATSLPAPLVLLAGRGARRALGFDESVLEVSPLLDSDLVRFYAAATAVLVPSYYEGFGLSALEAMACGAPVIAADAGAHREIVGAAGLLVDSRRPNAWREACQRVFRDADLRKRLSEGGTSRAARFSWDDCAQKTLTVYRRALKLT
jgi:glycosyltransferase involved in cell wall biosynthesis